MDVWWNGETYVAEWFPEEKAARATYYRSPIVRWFEAGYGADGSVAGGALPESGYYVLHHCGNPDCCRPEGPFKSEPEAQEWSRQNLVEPYV
jgi:hypothetical protein